jgi:hypothetical protein
VVRAAAEVVIRLGMKVQRRRRVLRRRRGNKIRPAHNARSPTRAFVMTAVAHVAKPWSTQLARELEQGSFERLLALAQRRLAHRGELPAIACAGDACRWVGYAFALAILQFDHALVRPLLEVGIAFAERGVAVPLATQGTPVAVHEQQRTQLQGRAQCWHARALAESLRAGAAPASASVQRAHADYVAFAAPVRGQWQPKFYLPAVHGGVELCLAAGRVDLAASLLPAPPPYEPCAHRHALLLGLVAALPRHAGEGRGKVVDFLARLGRAGRAPEAPPALAAGSPPRAGFEQFFELWRAPRGGDWRAHPQVLDPQRPEPDQTLATVAYALIEDRYVHGHATPDWRRVLQRLDA